MERWYWKSLCNEVEIPLQWESNLGPHDLKSRVLTTRLSEGLSTDGDNPGIMSEAVSSPVSMTYGDIIRNIIPELTLDLQNSDMSCLCKQCRSRSVGFWRSQLICIYTVSLSMWICIKRLHQIILLAENSTWAWHLNLFSMPWVNMSLHIGIRALFLRHIIIPLNLVH